MPRHVRVACPACGARFRADVAVVARTTDCLACSAQVPVPGRGDLLRRREPPALTVDEAAVEDTPTDERRSREASTGPFRPQTVFDKLALVRRVPTDVRPALPFLSGVFTFPWYPEVVVRWLWLSLGCTLWGLIGTTILWTLVVGGPMLRATFAFGFPFGWISIWTFSYAAACALPIITETAAGNEEVAGWPEPYWKAWFVDLLRVGFTLFQVVAVAYGVGRGIGYVTGQFWPPFLGTVFLLAPICLLSSLDADSVLVPITPLILLSLLKRWWAWLLFYVEAAALACAWPGLLVAGFAYQPFAASALTGPLMAAALLIYARLLGRLGEAVASAAAE